VASAVWIDPIHVLSDRPWRREPLTGSWIDPSGLDDPILTAPGRPLPESGHTQISEQLVENRHVVSEVLPVSDVAVKIKVPAGRSVSSVYLAPDRQEVDYQLVDGVVTLSLPRLDVHAMVVVETLDDSAAAKDGPAPGQNLREGSAWFDVCTRRWLLEFNVRDEPPFLSELDPIALAEAAVAANIDWFWVHAMDNGGTLFHNTAVGHKNSALGNRDFIREFTEALTDRGIRWGFHVNMTKNQWMYNLRPEWRQKWNDGTDRGSTDVNPDWDNLCPNSPHRDYNLAVLRELSTNYNPEGYWIDRLDWGGILPEKFSCACRYCTQKFENETGFTFPLQADWDAPVWHAFVEWRAKSLTEFLWDIRAAIKGIDENITVCLSTHNGLDMFGYWFHGQHIETIMEPADHVTQELHAEREGYLAYSLHPRFTRAVSGGKPMDGITFRHTGDLDYAFKPHAQLEAEACSVIAQGGAVMFEDLLYAEGTIEPHTYDWMRPIFDMLERKQEWLGGEPVRYVAVYFSRATRLYYGKNDPGEKYLLNFLGVCKALLEAHVVFDIVTDRGLMQDQLAKYEAVVLPNAACLSDAAADEVRAYVREGGSLLSTYMSSMFHANGRPRGQFGLSDVFGALYREMLGLPLSYLSFPSGSALAEGLVPDVPILHRREHLKVRNTTGSKSAATVMQAREGTNRLSSSCHPPLRGSEALPGAILNEFGKGRSVYFAGQPDAVYARWGHPEYRKLLSNSIYWLTGNRGPLEVTAPMCVESTLMEHSENGRLVAHLVNYQPELSRTWNLVREKFLA